MCYRRRKDANVEKIKKEAQSLSTEYKKIKEKLYCCDIIRDFLPLSPLTPAVVQMDRLKKETCHESKGNTEEKAVITNWLKPPVTFVY